MIIDTHAHLDDSRFAHDLPGVLTRAEQAGVGRIITIGISAATSRQAVELAERHDPVYAVVGIHPNEAAGVDADPLRTIEELAEHPKVVAIGETGLDFFRDRVPREAQRELFKRHIALALRLELPLVIHSRDAAAEAIETLSSHGVTQAVLHCFNGSAADAERARSHDYYIGVDAPITYPTGQAPRDAALAAGAEGLLVETDAPYLPPQSRRGKRNEPAFLVDTLDALGKLFGLPGDRISAITTANAMKLFTRLGHGGSPTAQQI